MVKPISDIRKPEIIQGAISALQKHGLAMISYDLIAEEADMSRQLIRHYFPDSDQLMVAVCDALAATHKEALAEGVIAADQTERLGMFMDMYFNILSGDQTPRPIDDAAYNAMMSIATNSDAVRETLKQQYQLLQNTVAHEVRISNPKLSQNACAEIGYLFCSLVYGHWRMVATLGFSESHNAIARAALERLITSYVAHYADPDLEEPVPSNQSVRAS